MANNSKGPVRGPNGKFIPKTANAKSPFPQRQAPPVISKSSPKEDQNSKNITKLRNRFADKITHIDDGKLLSLYDAYISTQDFNEAFDQGDSLGAFLFFLDVINELQPPAPSTTTEPEDTLEADDDALEDEANEAAYDAQLRASVKADREDLIDDAEIKRERQIQLADLEDDIPEDETDAFLEAMRREAEQDDLEDEEPELSEEEDEYRIANSSNTTNIQVNAYVHERDEDDTIDPEDLINIMTGADASMPDVDFMIDYFTSHELDSSKRKNFIAYLQSLDPQGLKALWESFKGTYGPATSTVTALDRVGSLVNAVESSKSLKLRNAAAHAELSRMGTVYAQLERTLRLSATDMPLGALRVDNLSAAIAKMHRDLTTMNSAVIEMAQMLMLGDVTGEAVDMAINPERAAKICAIVGYSAKAWAKVYDHAVSERSILSKKIEELTNSLKQANEVAANNQVLMQQEAKRVAELIIRADSYTIRNNSGFYLTTTNKPEPGTDYFRVSPYNVTLTTNESEALYFDDLEIARQVYDAMLVWGRKTIRVKRMFKEAMVNHETLFIAASSMVKVD